MSEHDEQVTFFDWVRLNREHAPKEQVRKVMKLCYAVPNGGARNAVVGKKMKAEGVEPGMPDINLDWPAINKNAAPGILTIRDLFLGLRIEMKFGKNKLTLKQEEKKVLLEEAGFKVAVCYSAAKAVKAVFDYLPFEEKDYQGIKEFL